VALWLSASASALTTTGVDPNAIEAEAEAEASESLFVSAFEFEFEFSPFVFSLSVAVIRSKLSAAFIPCFSETREAHMGAKAHVLLLDINASVDAAATYRPRRRIVDLEVIGEVE